MLAALVAGKKKAREPGERIDPARTKAATTTLRKLTLALKYDQEELRAAIAEAQAELLVAPPDASSSACEHRQTGQVSPRLPSPTANILSPAEMAIELQPLAADAAQSPGATALAAKLDPRRTMSPPARLWTQASTVASRHLNEQGAPAAAHAAMWPGPVPLGVDGRGGD